jgi:hypothetical protein
MFLKSKYNNNILYSIKRNNKYGFINDDGNIVIEPKYDYIGNFSNGVCAVYRNTPEVDFIYNNQTLYYSEMSLIDVEGNILIPFVKYLSHTCFYEEKAFVYHQKIKKWGVINKQGEIIIPFIFDNSDYCKFSNDLAAIKINEKYGFIDSLNHIQIPFEYDKAQDFSEGYSLVKKGNKEFFIDTNGSILKLHKYQIISGFKN